MSLSFLNNPKALDLSYKTDLDFWGWLGREQNMSYNRKNLLPYLFNEWLSFVWG